MNTGQFYGVYGVQFWFTVRLNILCAEHNAYTLCMYIKEEKERERDASEVLRRNSVIILGGRDRPGKIIFRWEGNQFHDRIGEPSIRTEAGAGNATESGLNSNGCFFFEYYRREHCFLRGQVVFDVSSRWVI